MVNFLLAYAFGAAVSLISRSWFLPSVVAGYWLANVIGFVLLHKGVIDAILTKAHPYTAQQFAKDFTISVGYTVLVVLLVWLRSPSVSGGLFAALGH